MLHREGLTYIVTDITGSQYKTKDKKKALKREHFVNISGKKYDRSNRTILKEVRNNKREVKKLYENKRLND